MKFRTQRNYSYSRTLMGGCFVCHGGDAHWYGANAQGVAVRHHDATGHATWVDVVMMLRYGEEAVEHCLQPTPGTQGEIASSDDLNSKPVPPAMGG